MPALRSIALLLAAGAAAAHAADVYKCTNAAGAVTFQDVPCAAGEREATLHLAAPPAVPLPPPTSSAPAAPAVAPPGDAAPAAPPVEPPAMFVCTRAEDGTTYMSYDGAPPVRMVPGGVLGMPGGGVAANRGGGVSAPGVRKIPVDTSPQAAPAADYVPVQDQCVPAAAETTCNYLRGEYDRIHAKLRRAFKDEQAVLQPQLDALDAQLDGC